MKKSFITSGLVESFKRPESMDQYHYRTNNKVRMHGLISAFVGCIHMGLKQAFSC